MLWLVRALAPERHCRFAQENKETENKRDKNFSAASSHTGQFWRGRPARAAPSSSSASSYGKYCNGATIIMVVVRHDCSSEIFISDIHYS
jgi:hypothetical protein